MDIFRANQLLFGEKWESTPQEWAELGKFVLYEIENKRMLNRWREMAPVIIKNLKEYKE